MKLLKLFPDEREEEELIDEERVAERATTSPPRSFQPNGLLWTVGWFAVALLPRLFTLFRVTGTQNGGDGWLGDVYHHWQIAYLTKEIGLTAPGGPRLWDLRGLDYFWGILHPLLLVGLFFVTGSIDIVVGRLLTLSFGALVVVLIFHLCRRYWGIPVAIAAAGFAAFVPTSVFDDTTGMLEPLGVGFSLLAIWLWPKRGLWTGLSLALAAMARAESWIFSFGLLIAALLRKQAIQQRLPLLGAWTVAMLLYMKVLLDKTGNPIYPVWWNFLANAFGSWETRAQLTPTELAVRPFLGIVLVVAVVGLTLTLVKRPASYMLLTYGFGYCVFTAGMLGFTAYLKSWETWFWMTRFFAFPYQFAGILVAVGLFLLVPRYLGKKALYPAAALGAAGLLAVQVAWLPILDRFQLTKPFWARAMVAGQYVGDVYGRPQYRGTTLTFPSDHPDVTYTMARFGHVEGKHIVSQLYDPFYDAPAGYKYADHRELAGTLLQCWLEKTKTKLLVVEPTNENYRMFVSDHPAWFHEVGKVPYFEWTLEEVAVPKPAPVDCQSAASQFRSQTH